MVLTEKLNPQDILRAVQLLKQGHVVAFPTETVYGLGAPIFDPDAVAAIFELKRRPSDNPLIAHIATLDQIHEIAIDIPPLFFVLAQAFFPGPLTLILKKHPAVPSIVSGGMDTIAVRMPQDPIARRLIAEVGQPLVAPSANLSGKPSATHCEHVLEDFMGSLKAVIDGGPTELGIESTVVSLLQDPPQLLRPGSITKEQIEDVIGYLIEQADSHVKEGPVTSPGMKYRHYAPLTPLKLFRTENDLREYLANHPQECPMVLTRYTSFDLVKGDHYCLSAKQLYALLRLADVRCYSIILILGDESLLKDPALTNRLLRASQ